MTFFFFFFKRKVKKCPLKTQDLQLYGFPFNLETFSILFIYFCLFFVFTVLALFLIP